MTVFKEKDFIRKMMKMNYIKPEIEVVECEFESHIASMSGLEDTEWGGETEGGEADGNRHRGEWGNLWAN